MTSLLRSCHCENALLGTPETSRRNFLGLGLCHFDIFFLFNWTGKWEESCKNQAFNTNSYLVISVEIWFRLISGLKTLAVKALKPSWITSKITLIHVIEKLKIHVVKLKRYAQMYTYMYWYRISLFSFQNL